MSMHLFFHKALRHLFFFEKKTRNPTFSAIQLVFSGCLKRKEKQQDNKEPNEKKNNLKMRKKECKRDRTCVPRPEVDSFCDPKCTQAGYFKPVWSHPLARNVHCRDPFDGKEIPGSGIPRPVTKTEWERQEQHCYREQLHLIQENDGIVTKNEFRDRTMPRHAQAATDSMRTQEEDLGPLSSPQRRCSMVSRRKNQPRVASSLLPSVPWLPQTVDLQAIGRKEAADPTPIKNRPPFDAAQQVYELEEPQPSIRPLDESDADNIPKTSVTSHPVLWWEWDKASGRFFTPL